MVVGFANGSASLLCVVLMRYMPELKAFRTVAFTLIISMSLFLFISSSESIASPLLTYTIVTFGSLGATGMINSFLLVAELRVPPQSFSAMLVIL